MSNNLSDLDDIYFSSPLTDVIIEDIAEKSFGNSKFPSQICKEPKIVSEIIKCLESESLETKNLAIYCLTNLLLNSKLPERKHLCLFQNANILTFCLKGIALNDRNLNVDFLFDILFCATHEEEVADMLRSLNAVAVFKKVIDECNDMENDAKSVSSLLGLVNLLGRDENVSYVTSETSIITVLRYYDNSLQGTPFNDCYWVPQYILPSLYNLSFGDINKGLLIKNVAIELMFGTFHELNAVYNRFPKLVDIFYTRKMSLMILLNLSFDDASNGLITVKLLNDLVIDRDDTETNDVLNKILWSLKQKERNVSTVTKTENNNSDDTANYVMISYCWAQQPFIFAFIKHLKEQGVRYWLDVEQMSGSTLEAMANAVEGAAAIFLCVSRKYKDSANCRLEGEYAQKLGKKMIPLMVEKDYTADGWLGLLLGSKLWYKMWDAGEHLVQVPSLLHEVNVKLTAVTSIKIATANAASNSIEDVSQQSGYREEVVAKYTIENVADWLKQCNLNTLVQSFDELHIDGECLSELRHIYDNDKCFFNDFITKELKIVETSVKLKFGRNLKRLITLS